MLVNYHFYVLQDDDVEPGIEACILVACHTLAHSPSNREAVTMSPLLEHAADRALGRGAPAAVCIPAMHTIAAVGGAQYEVRERGTVEAAQLSAAVIFPLHYVTSLTMVCCV